MTASPLSPEGLWGETEYFLKVLFTLLPWIELNLDFFLPAT